MSPIDPQLYGAFVAAGLLLNLTPGPDMLFVASQSLSGGAYAGLRSTTGVCLGYTRPTEMGCMVHSWG